MVKFPDKKPLIDYTHTLRSRYGETDKMGYVYYGRYLEYFEVARTEMIRSFGISYRQLEDQGIMLPVIHTEIDYKKPIFYDVEMKIRVLVFDVPSVRLQTFYEVTTKEDPTIHILGEVSLCFTNAETRRPCRAPDSFLDRFNAEIL
ncbi:MAG: thioesterase family protein [Balneolaceae bacterium]